MVVNNATGLINTTTGVFCFQHNVESGKNPKMGFSIVVVFLFTFLITQFHRIDMLGRRGGMGIGHVPSRKANIQMNIFKWFFI